MAPDEITGFPAPVDGQRQPAVGKEGLPAGDSRAEAIQASALAAAEWFLRFRWGKDAMSASLQRVGEAVEARRVSLCEKTFSLEGIESIQVLHDWVAWEDPSEGRADLAFTASLVAPCTTAFNRGEIVASLDPSPADGPLSLVPVQVAGNGWGFIAIERGRDARPWYTSELSALTGFARIVGGALQCAREEALRRQTEDRYRVLVETSFDIIWEVDARGCYTAISPKIRDLLGYEPEEVLGRSSFDFMAPEEAGRVATIMAGVLSTASSFRNLEKSYRHKDGHTVDFESSGSPVFGPNGELVGYRGSARDVTRRRQAERELRESEAKLRSYIEHAPVGVVVSDANGFIVEANPAAESMLGYQPGGLLGLAFSDLIAPHDPDPAWRHFTGAGEGGTADTLLRLRHLSGRSLSVAIRAVKLGENRRMSIYHDITQRIEAEQASRRSEERLRAAAVAGGVANFEHTHISGELYLSSLMREFYEFDPEEVVTLGKLLDRIPEVERPQVQAAVAEAANPHGKGRFDVTHRILLRNGGFRWIRSVAQTEFSGIGPERRPIRSVGAVVDITAQKEAEIQRTQLEELLRQAQKMEAIGRLSGGVAHDFNNILTVIKGNASLLSQDAQLTPDNLELVQEITRGADRAANLTRQLLTFSRQQTLRRKSIDLNQVIDGVAQMFGRVLGEDIEVELCLSKVPLVIFADAGMVEQVLVNLGVNSRDAMPKGGRLTIRTEAIDLTEQSAQAIQQARPGAFVKLTVADNGTGISPEDLPRIFEPFFTTKKVGKGTGLGLASAYGIVSQHEGWICVRSEPGRGTQFEIYLPRSTSPAVAGSTMAHNGPSAAGREGILVVEDETTLRLVIRTLLTRAGYSVLEASSGRAAMEVWEVHKEEIRLVVSDQVMPGGLNGLDLIEVLREERPDLRAIITTGYSPDYFGANDELLKHVQFLPKPFSPEELARVVRATLDEPGG